MLKKEEMAKEEKSRARASASTALRSGTFEGGASAIDSYRKQNRGMGWALEPAAGACLQPLQQRQRLQPGLGYE